METNKTIETRGLIIKEERVISLESNILENTLVLENKDAFSDFFGENLPDEKSPRSLFIVLDKKYDALFLARTLKNTGAKMKHKCYGSFGEIIIAGKTNYCIRIKNLDCFPSVINIQNALADSGIEFKKHQHINENALIRIHKSFLVHEISGNIFKDLFEKDRYYFTIPSELEWEQFKKITSIVKSNLENNLFDAAMGIMWKIEGMIDIVRIYDKKNDPERIKTIRDRYIAEINHLKK